jgi:DNA-binding NarL/FixJ family response regulator
MNTEDPWALYLRLQSMARHASATDRGWALDEALAFVIEEIAAGRRASDAQIDNILLNRAAKHRRRRRLVVKMPQPGCTIGPAEACLELADRLQRCAPRDQLILKALASGFTVEEVAAQYRVPTGTIKTWAHRARMKFAA